MHVLPVSSQYKVKFQYEYLVVLLLFKGVSLLFGSLIFTLSCHVLARHSSQRKKPDVCMKKQVTHGRNQIGSSRARHTAPAQDIIREGSFHPASFAVFALLSLLVMFGWYVFVCDTLLQNLGRLHPTKGIPP